MLWSAFMLETSPVVMQMLDGVLAHAFPPGTRFRDPAL